LLTVRIVPYDPLWPLEYAAEADRIEAACRGLPIRLEHIGSTSVPGLGAKPVIDILAGCPPRANRGPYIAAFRQLGYEHKGSFGIPGRDFFRRGSPRSHHVHLYRWSSTAWRDHVMFRDALRADAALAREYEALKRQLAAAPNVDVEQYAHVKGPFVRHVLRIAAAHEDAAGASTR